MKAVNGFVKVLGYIVIYAILCIAMYLLSLLTTAPILCVVESIYNLTGNTSEWFGKNFYITYLISSVPLAVVYTVIVLLDLINKFTAWKRRLK